MSMQILKLTRTDDKTIFIPVEQIGSFYWDGDSTVIQIHHQTIHVKEYPKDIHQMICNREVNEHRNEMVSWRSRCMLKKIQDQLIHAGLIKLGESKTVPEVISNLIREAKDLDEACKARGETFNKIVLLLHDAGYWDGTRSVFEVIQDMIGKLHMVELAVGPEQKELPLDG